MLFNLQPTRRLGGIALTRPHAAFHAAEDAAWFLEDSSGRSNGFLHGAGSCTWCHAGAGPGDLALRSRLASALSARRPSQVASLTLPGLTPGAVLARLFLVSDAPRLQKTVDASGIFAIWRVEVLFNSKCSAVWLHLPKTAAGKQPCSFVQAACIEARGAARYRSQFEDGSFCKTAVQGGMIPLGRSCCLTRLRRSGSGCPARMRLRPVEAS